MSITLPKAFHDLIQSQIKDWEAFNAAHQQPSPASIRLHPRKTHNELSFKRVPWCENGYYLPQRPAYFMDPLFHAGVYYPQEAGSMLLHQALRQLPVQREGLRVLDLCAAPGGKSTLILDWLDGNGFLVSNEIISKRARVLEENLNKWGYANRMVSNSTPAQLAKAKAAFDVVVVDAPCSGEGMFRKEPDALQMWCENTVNNCQRRQQEILENAAQCLRPGGFLIYSTCTYNLLENEAVLEAFTEKTGAKPIALEIPANWKITPSESAVIHGYRCFPHLTESEGFFISVLKIPGEKSASDFKKKSVPKKSKTPKPAANLHDWIKNADLFSTLEHRGELFIYQREADEFIHRLTPQIHVLSVGQPAGKFIRDKLIPSAALALSIDLDISKRTTYELDDTQVLHFLTKADFAVETRSNGLVLCTYEGTPLGWAKIINGRLKNQWPKEWRILHPEEQIAHVI